jgi:outer membrane protein assembly factor BamB
VVSSVSGLSSDPVLFVGGNDPNVSPSQSTPIFYAIDALTGDVLWHTKANQLAPVGSYDWSSPAVYTPTGATDPRIYVGLASVNDCPLVQGKLFQLDARTGPCRYLQYGA